jgi:hypothetical protein
LLTPSPDQETQDGTANRPREPQADSRTVGETVAPTTRESTQDTGRRDSTPSSIQGQDTGLTSYTAQEVTDNLNAQEQADKDRAAADKKADADDKAAREARDVASRQEANADNFQLGRSAEHSLPGQTDLFAD